MEDVWIEKYRPKNLNEVVGQDEVTMRLRSYVERRSLPHLLFAGPAGTGKTTCAIALARELFGEFWRQNFHELNASDERGIDVVRGTIKDFARTAPMGGSDFKIIFLDEADSLTHPAQAALRRTMERFSTICRFILSCNYSSRIIDPIQSRCAVFRFRPLKNKDVENFLRRIAEKEGLEITDDGMDAIIYVSQGDMRKAINTLQVAASLQRRVEGSVVYQVTAMARPEDIRRILEEALKGNFITARSILDNLLIEAGLSGEDVLKQLHREVYALNIPDQMKVELIDYMGEIEIRLIAGGNERIQMEGLLAKFALLGRELYGAK